LPVNENADENEIPFMAKNDTKMDINFRSKNENERHLIIVVFFHTFSHQVSPTMRHQYLVQFRLFADGPCWRDSTFLMSALWHFSRWH